MQNRVVKLLNETVKDWVEDRALRLSAALAYYSVFSIAPLLVIAIGVAGLVFGEEAVRGELAQQLKAYVGPQAAEAVQSMVQSAAKPTQGWISTITGFVVLMLGASGVFGQLKDALNTIWEVRARGGEGFKGFIRARMMTFGMVLCIGFLLLTSLLLSTAIAALNDYLEKMLHIPGFVWTSVSFVISLAIVTVLFALIFKVLPDARIQWRHVWIGAFVTAVLFELGKFGLGIYLGRESTASTYGAAASVVLLLLWVYYTSCILFFGAEFTQVYARSQGDKVPPSPDALPVTAVERAHQGLSPDSKCAEPIPATATAYPVEVPALEPGGALRPAGALLLVTAASFVVGLLARRWTEAARDPSARVRDGLTDLGAQAATQLTDLLERTQSKLAHRFS